MICLYYPANKSTKINKISKYRILQSIIPHLNQALYMESYRHFEIELAIVSHHLKLPRRRTSQGAPFFFIYARKVSTFSKPYILLIILSSDELNRRYFSRASILTHKFLPICSRLERRMKLYYLMHCIVHLRLRCNYYSTPHLKA